MPTPVPTPSAAEISQLARDASQVLTIWNSLGPVMAVILVCAFALAVVFLSQRDTSKGNSAVLRMLADNNVQKDKDIVDLKAQRDQENKQHLERMDAQTLQMTRTNDLIEKSNEILTAQMDRGLERDAVQKQFADDFHVLINTGSKPVQDILSRVQTIAESVARIDTRTAGWEAVVSTVTPLMNELSAYRAEAKRHSTQPIPPVAMDNANGTEPES